MQASELWNVYEKYERSSELLYVAYFEILKRKPSKDTLRHIITLDLLSEYVITIS